MKKLLFALCALAAIALLTPSAGFADWQNRFGIYTTDTAGGTRVDPAIGVPFYVYFVLTSPTAVDGSPITAIKGWEYLVTVVGPEEGLARTADVLLPGAYNFGDVTNYYNSTYLVGLTTALPVTNNMISLHRWTVRMYDDTAPYYFYLSPCSTPTFPGKLAFLDAGGQKVSAIGSTDLFTTAVFAIGDDTVSAQSETFGSVKALFR